MCGGCLHDKTREDCVGLWLRDGDHGPNSKDSEQNVASKDDRCGRHVTWTQSDVATVDSREQKQAEPCSEEPDSVGRPLRIEVECEAGVDHRDHGETVCR